MALDGIVIRALVHELQSLVGARIHKIHQPSEHDLLWQVRGINGSQKLLLSANPTYPRVHFTTYPFANPQQPPMFCMLLRKHCEGGVIETIEQVGNERIIQFRVRQRDEVGDIAYKLVIVELMGRHSNIVLVDANTGIIHDGIHHVTPAISSYRIIMPGVSYVAPPSQNKANPLDIRSFAQFCTSFANVDQSARLEQQIVNAFSGISPLLSKELCTRAEVTASSIPSSTTDYEPLWTVFADVMEQFNLNQYEPQICTGLKTNKAVFAMLSLTHVADEGNVQRFASVSECLEAFYGEKAERDTVKQRATDLIRFLSNEQAKNFKKLEKLHLTLQEGEQADHHRILGELITAYMYQIQRGDNVVEVINYYEPDEPTIAIGLDPQLSPSENAQRYFKKYTKAKNSIVAVKQQLTQTDEDIRYFSTLLQQMDNASLNDIEEIRDELVEQGYLRARAKRGEKKKKNYKPSLLCYTSSEGIAIYVGKNNTQNDYLTNKLASSQDTWLHTKDIPGSHVVIRATEFGNATLEEAAMLAAHYSQARDSSLVPVDYTLQRYVKKPSGSKPGFVIYDHQKTLFVTPDGEKIKSLTCSLKQ